MTKCHFVAIAEAVRFLDLPMPARAHVAERLAETLRQFNSRFEAERFISAATEPTAIDQARKRSA